MTQSDSSGPESNAPNAERRAVPQQARSIEKYHRVLDAADELFAEHGVQGTQMAQLIARSGVPAGSLYRFFPNKMAVAFALAERHRESLAPLQGLFAPATTVDDVMILIDLVVDVTVDYQALTPGYQAVREVISVDEPGPIRAAREDQVELFLELLGDVASHLSAETTRRMIEYVGVIVDLLTKQNPYSDDDHPRRIAELKRVLRAYVRDVLESGETPET